MLSLLLAALLATDASSSTTRLLTAVRYLESQYPFRNEDSRRALASSGNLHVVKDWQVSKRLEHYQLFYFQSTWGTSPPTYDIVAVGASGEVLLPKNKKDFNRLLAGEGLVPRDKAAAQLLGMFYIQVTNVTAVVNSGLADGVEILDCIDDIPSLSDRDRRTLLSITRIAPPSVDAVEPGKFRVTVFAWQREGSGAVERREIVFDDAGLASAETVVLVVGAGAFEAIQ